MAYSLRRERARRAAAAVVVVGSVFASSAAHAFCRTTTASLPANYNPSRGCFTEGLPLFWKNQCVGYSVNRAASERVSFDDATAVIDQAFATWTSATCPDTGQAVGIQARNVGAVDCAEVRYNPDGPNQNVIVFRDTGWPYNDPNNTLGLTTVTFNAETGEIYDADMEINASGKNLTVGDPVPKDGFDLLSVITHEAGHFLGLAHAQSSSSTMYASYKPGSSALRTLTADDVAGICSIYPNENKRSVDAKVDASGFVSAEACNPAPRHGFGTTCEANSSSKGGGKSGCSTTSPATRAGDAALVALAVAAVVAAQRRRRAR
jgi:MYXO-CTERM domain-containing protein